MADRTGSRRSSSAPPPGSGRPSRAKLRPGHRVTLVAPRTAQALADEIGAATSKDVAIRATTCRTAEKYALGTRSSASRGRWTSSSSWRDHAAGRAGSTFEKDREILDVNLVGAVAWLDEAALGWRPRAAQDDRRQLRRGRPRAARDAGVLRVEGRAQLLPRVAPEPLSQHGVGVVTVRRGYVATPMTEGLGLPSRPRSPPTAQRAHPPRRGACGPHVRGVGTRHCVIRRSLVRVQARSDGAGRGVRAGAPRPAGKSVPAGRVSRPRTAEAA